jgi:hypothetical protein
MLSWDFVSKNNEGLGLSPSLRDHGGDPLALRLAILSGKGACEGSACYAVLEDLLDQELV